MTRSELKVKLETMGANLDLLEMPAVMERLYYMFDVSDRGPYEVEEVEKIVLGGEHYSTVEDVVKLDDEGNMMLLAKDGSHIGRFSMDPYGEGATFVNENYYGAIYYIDKFGMDKSFIIKSIQEGKVNYSVDRNLDGKFVIDGLDFKTVEDDGRPIINYRELKEEFEFGKFRNALPTMRENKEYLMPLYPSVERWYDEKIVNISRKNLNEKKDACGEEISSMLDEALVGMNDLRTSIEADILSNPETEKGRQRFEREYASMTARMKTLQRQSEEYQVQNQRLAESLAGSIKLNQSILQELQKGVISKKVNRRILERYAPELLNDKEK